MPSTPVAAEPSLPAADTKPDAIVRTVPLCTLTRPILLVKPTHDVPNSGSEKHDGPPCPASATYSRPSRPKARSRGLSSPLTTVVTVADGVAAAALLPASPAQATNAAQAETARIRIPSPF